MGTRKIIDLKQNGEKVWLKGHAKAIYMSDGTTVEDAINNIEVGTEIDLSNYATKEDLTSKQDKIDNIVVSEDVNEELDDVETNTYIKYVAQTLTEEQKSQVRSNIGVDLSSYATTEYVDNQIGDINSILISIINQ